MVLVLAWVLWVACLGPCLCPEPVALALQALPAPVMQEVLAALVALPELLALVVSPELVVLACPAWEVWEAWVALIPQ